MPTIKKRKGAGRGLISAFSSGVSSAFDISTDISLPPLPRVMTPEERIAESWKKTGDAMRKALADYGKKKNE